MYGTRDVALNPVTPTALLTTAEARALLGVSGSGDDARIDAMVLSATAQIEAYLGGLVVQRTVTETLWPEDANATLLLSHGPLIGLTSISEDTTALTVGDFVLLKAIGGLRKSDETRFSANAKYSVVYTAGYASGSMPPAITEACRLLVRDAWLAKDREAIVSRESVDAVGAVGYGGEGMLMKGQSGGAVPVAVANILAPHVRRFSGC